MVTPGKDQSEASWDWSHPVNGGMAPMVGIFVKQKDPVLPVLPSMDWIPTVNP